MTALKRRLIAIVSVLALAGCEAPRERSRFISAALAEDGRTGVFVFKREVYYPGAIGLLGPGRPDRYLQNRTVVGAYDLASGETRVLYRRENGSSYVNELLDLHVREVRGSRALLSEGDGGHYWLDLETGGLTPLPLREELAARGRETGVVYLVDARGTLVSVNRALRDVSGAPAAAEIWLRRHTGEYERIAEVPQGSEGFYGFADGELHFYSAAQRAYLIYNLERREFRRGDPRRIPRPAYERTSDFRADEHGSPQPQVGRKVGGRWEYTDAQVDVGAL